MVKTKKEWEKETVAYLEQVICCGVGLDTNLLNHAKKLVTAHEMICNELEIRRQQKAKSRAKRQIVTNVNKEYLDEKDKKKREKAKKLMAEAVKLLEDE